MCVVYCISCLENNKKYIGSSINFDRRIYHHFYQPYYEEGNTPLKKDIIKYNPERFVFGIIEEVEEEDRFDKEKYYIRKYNTIEEGYNIMTPLQTKREYYLQKEESIREYQREYQKQYREKNKEYMRERNRRYYRERKQRLQN